MAEKSAPQSRFQLFLLHAAIFAVPSILVAATVRPPRTLFFPLIAVLPTANLIERLTSLNFRNHNGGSILVLAAVFLFASLVSLVAADVRFRGWCVKLITLAIGLANAALMPAAISRLS